MVCQGIGTLATPTVIDILKYPTSCDFYFWGKIMGAVFIVLSLILFLEERGRVGRADLISSLGVGALATIFIALTGTVAGFIENSVFILIFVIGIIFVSIWMIKKD